MSQANNIVDILLEDGGTDLEAFVRGAGILTPGVSVARNYVEAKAEKQNRQSLGGRVNRGAQAWFYTKDVKFGPGNYRVHGNTETNKTYCRCTVNLPDVVKQTFGIYRTGVGAAPLQIRNTVSVAPDAESVRDGIDKLYRWATTQLRKWDDLVFLRRTFKRIAQHDLAGTVDLEFRQKFKVVPMAELESNGYAKSTILPKVAQQMRAWLQARLQQLGIHESEEPQPDQYNMGIDMEKFVRDAGVSVTMDDFVVNSSMDRFGRWSTGNVTWSVSYKRLLYKGKPVFLGLVHGAHDYNRTGHAGIVSYYAVPPSTTKDYFPVNKRTGERYKRAKQRTYAGYGAVRFASKEAGKGHYDNLFDCCKYLLSLLKVQYPLKHAESLGESDNDLAAELAAVASDPILIRKNTRVSYSHADGQAYYFTVSLLRSRKSYWHSLGLLRRDNASGKWSIAETVDVLLRKHIAPYPDKARTFDTDVDAERALVQHIVGQFPGLVAPRG